MNSNPRQLEPINFPKINVNPNTNYKSNDNNINNLRVKRPGNFSSTASVFFNQNKKLKNLGSTSTKEIPKMKKPFFTISFGDKGIKALLINKNKMFNKKVKRERRYDNKYLYRMVECLYCFLLL